MKKLAALGGGVIAAVVVGLLILALVAAILIGGIVTSTSGMIAGVVGQQANSEAVCTPGGTTAGGTPVTGSQEEIVAAMKQVAEEKNISEKGQVIATMVMFQESGVQNYANNGDNHFGYPIGSGTSKSTDWWLDTAKFSLEYPHDAVGSDADSVGFYQQRASAGWGDGEGYTAATSDDHGRKAVERLMDPKWGAQAFFGGEGGPANGGLLEIDGWESMAPTVAAQRVQGSAFPDAYAKWEGQATDLVASSDGVAPAGGGGDDDDEEDDTADTVSVEDDGGDDEDSGDEDSSGSGAVQRPVAEGTVTETSPYGYRSDPATGDNIMHSGSDWAGPLGTPIYAAADGRVREAGPEEYGFGQWIVIDHNIDGKKYSTVYGHMPDDGGVLVKKDAEVSKGDKIGVIGSNGYSTGPHLHLEVWEGGRLDGGKHIDPMKWLAGNHAESGPVGEFGLAGGDCTTLVGAKTGGGGGAVTAEDGTVDAVIENAEQQIGVDYSWGGGDLEGPSEGINTGGLSGVGVTGFDCSSLVRYAVYHGSGKSVTLPRVASEQYAATSGNEVGLDEMERGDIMFWKRGSDIYHVAIYMGDGKMIEAPTIGEQVKISNVEDKRANLWTATRVDFSG